LLDTNTCIAAMRHHTLVLQRMAAVSPADCAISSITSYVGFAVSDIMPLADESVSR
jgi:hypothetical protein